MWEVDDGRIKEDGFGRWARGGMEDMRWAFDSSSSSSDRLLLSSSRDSGI